MGQLLRIGLRGFVLVFLTATNVVQVSHAHYWGALVGGFLISWVWWQNAFHASRAVRGGAVAYGLGAALGTVCGMKASYWLLGRGL